MNVAAGLTPTQCAAHERHLNFQKSISDRATALKKAKMESAINEMVAAFKAEAKSVGPEIVPAEAPAPQKSDCWFAPSDSLSCLPTVETIQKAVCKYYGVSKTDLISARRTWDVVRPRQVGYYLSKELTLRSLPDIGRRFGGRDHTSAISGIKKIKRLLLIDAELAHDIAMLIEQITGTQQ